MSHESAVAEPDFPSAATDAEILRFLVNYAILAPSSHNTQPWLFRIGEQSLELIADRTRALPQDVSRLPPRRSRLICSKSHIRSGSKEGAQSLFYHPRLPMRASVRCAVRSDSLE